MPCEIGGMDFRDRIRKVLADNEWSVREVSLRAGSDSMLYKVLNPDKRGGIKWPTIEKMEEIAKALKVAPGWLAFGESDGLSEELISEMAEIVAEEIQPGLSIAQIRSAVASGLREQLALHLSVGARFGSADDASAPGTGAQSPAPTKKGGSAGSRSA